MDDALRAFEAGRYNEGATLALEALEQKGDMVRGLLAIHCLLRSGQYIDAVGLVGRLKSTARFHALDCAAFDHAIGHRRPRDLQQYVSGKQGDDLVATCNLLYQKSRGNVLQSRPGPNPLLPLWEADQGPLPTATTLASIAQQMRRSGAGRQATQLLREAWRWSRDDPARKGDLLSAAAGQAQIDGAWDLAAANWARAATSYTEAYGQADWTTLQAAMRAVEAYHRNGDWPAVIREASWLMRYRDRLPDAGQQTETCLAGALVEADRPQEALPILERLYNDDPSVAGRLVHALIATGQGDIAIDILAKDAPHPVMKPIDYAHHELDFALAYYAIGDEARGDMCVAKAFRAAQMLHDVGHENTSWLQANLARNLKAHGHGDKARPWVGSKKASGG